MDKRSGPRWLAPMEVKPGGVDWMGLQQPGLTMADALLPHITNTTSRARYYTVIGWLFTNGRTKRGIRVLESAFVHGVRLHTHPVWPTGVVGSQSIGDSQLDVLDTGLVGPDRRREPVSAMDAPFYGPSARNLRIAGRDEEGRLGAGALGRALAETVPIDTALLPHGGDTRIDRALAEALGCLCFCTSAQGQERELLEEVLFRHEHQETGDGWRRRTMALILDLVGQGARDELSTLQRAIDRLLGRDDYMPAEPLVASADGLGLVGLRWFYRYALETLWASLGRMIHEASPRRCSALPYVALTLDAADGRDRWAPAAGATLAEVLEGLGNSPGSESESYWLQKQNYDKDPARALLAAAVQLAGVARGVRSLDRDVVKFDWFLDLKAPWWCPMSGFANQFDERMRLEDWLKLLIDRYAIGQHFLTASRKWRDDIDGFFFQPTGEGYRLNMERFERSGTNWRRSWIPWAGGTKVSAVLSLCEDIGLVVSDSEGHQLTELGSATLQRVTESPGELR